jgi:hypothetical protein
MSEINTRRVVRELSVLRALVSALKALVDTGEKGRPATYYPNPNNPALTAFSVGRVPLDKIAVFLGGLYEQLATNEIGVMLDAIVLKPVIYKSAEDARTHSLKKTMFVNLSLCTWTREAIARMTTAAAPNDKFYNIDLLIPILDQLDADIEVVKFENECEDNDRPQRPKTRKQSLKFRNPLISAEQAMAVMESLGIGGAADKLLPALGFMSKPEKKEVPDGQV